MTRDKTRINSILHDAPGSGRHLMIETRKYGISESIIQALTMTLLQTMS